MPNSKYCVNKAASMVAIFRAVVVAFVMCTVHSHSFAQSITHQYVDSVLAKDDTSYQKHGMKRGLLYLVNGVLLEDSSKINKALEAYNPNRLLQVEYFRCKDFFHCRNDIAIILFAYPQKQKKKRKAWRAAKASFANKPAAQLMIDQRTIAPAIAEQSLRKLRFKDIMYVDTTTRNNTWQVRIWKKE